MCQPGEISDCTPLRETRKDDARCGHTARLFACNQGADGLARPQQARLVDFALGTVQREDVVPRWHDIAAVAAHRHGGRMRKDETYTDLARQAEFGYNGGEVVAVRAES